ncbi:hypothetical protein V5O48_012813 [Marasmius crinis-equi]|uniref:Uncharacterized protein n=1 Tax=Marasmius crinis-equi TaxID=585013 RepID=A0ABR3F1T3_9AGAR
MKPSNMIVEVTSNTIKKRKRRQKRQGALPGRVIDYHEVVNAIEEQVGNQHNARSHTTLENQGQEEALSPDHPLYRFVRESWKLYFRKPTYRSEEASSSGEEHRPSKRAKVFCPPLQQPIHTAWADPVRDNASQLSPLTQGQIAQRASLAGLRPPGAIPGQQWLSSREAWNSRYPQVSFSSLGIGEWVTVLKRGRYSQDVGLVVALAKKAEVPAFTVLLVPRKAVPGSAKKRNPPSKLPRPPPRLVTTPIFPVPRTASSQGHFNLGGERFRANGLTERVFLPTEITNASAINLRLATAFRDSKTPELSAYPMPHPDNWFFVSGEQVAFENKVGTFMQFSNGRRREDHQKALIRTLTGEEVQVTVWLLRKAISPGDFVEIISKSTTVHQGLVVSRQDRRLEVMCENGDSTVFADLNSARIVPSPWPRQNVPWIDTEVLVVRPKHTSKLAVVKDTTRVVLRSGKRRLFLTLWIPHDQATVSLDINNVVERVSKKPLTEWQPLTESQAEQYAFDDGVSTGKCPWIGREVYVCHGDCKGSSGNLREANEKEVQDSPFGSYLEFKVELDIISPTHTMPYCWLQYSQVVDSYSGQPLNLAQPLQEGTTFHRTLMQNTLSDIEAHDSRLPFVMTPRLARPVPTRSESQSSSSRHASTSDVYKGFEGRRKAEASRRAVVEAPTTLITSNAEASPIGQYLLDQKLVGLEMQVQIRGGPGDVQDGSAFVEVFKSSSSSSVKVRYRTTQNEWLVIRPEHLFPPHDPISASKSSRDLFVVIDGPPDRKGLQVRRIWHGHKGPLKDPGEHYMFVRAVEPVGQDGEKVTLEEFFVHPASLLRLKQTRIRAKAGDAAVKPIREQKKLDAHRRHVPSLEML